jgi:hypothetical protein
MFDLESTIPRKEMATMSGWRPSILGMPFQVVNIARATHLVHRLPLSHSLHPGMQATNAVPLWKLPNPPRPPPRIDGESTPTLTEVDPEAGSITGGARIWLKGIDFPAVFPLFARFGTAVVPTVRPRNLRCEPQLTEFLRLSLLATFLPVICPPQPCQVSSMLRYRSIPNKMRKGTEPASRSFTTWEIMTNCKFFEYMHPRSHPHLNEEFRYFCVYKDKDIRNSPRCCRHSSPLSMDPSQTAPHKEGVTPLDHETTQSKLA